ncbi:MAG: thiamine phosphate synthase [Sedimentisphaerales bacterium]|nr:thiamine phosphate synthase [Sedimentisphaerales bacterium]
MERAAYRIVDANFNRAREAIRAVEEYCRFSLNSKELTERAKRIRHELSAAIGGLDAGRLVSSRDISGDVGIGGKIDGQLVRSELKDCFTAGCKRLTEALRVLAETTQAFDQSVAEGFENIRYASYALEKDIFIFSDTFEKYRRVRLYVVVTSSLPAEVISLAYKCVDGGADCIQLRAKEVDDDVLYALAVEFVRICKNAGVLSVINDRVDVAVASRADGVHLGQNDLPIEQARKLQITPLITGKSTHTPRQLRAACEERPTYAALGPVHATATKPGAPAVGLGYVRQAREILAGTGIGNVAIGGITLENVEEVLEAGADAIAVCAAVTKASDPVRACRELKDKIVGYRQKLVVSSRMAAGE